MNKLTIDKRENPFSGGQNNAIMLNDVPLQNIKAARLTRRADGPNLLTISIVVDEVEYFPADADGSEDILA